MKIKFQIFDLTFASKKNEENASNNLTFGWKWFMLLFEGWQWSNRGVK